MNYNPKVSIVIPVYNGSNYLREAIDSALGQTYKNIEVIVVNDGSNDGGLTEEIALSYGDRIRYFSKENGGVASALNRGIREMTGDYFSWLSHDDVFAENRCETDCSLFGMKPEAKISFCRQVVIDEKGAYIREKNYSATIIDNLRDAYTVDFCSMTVHRTCFDIVGIFNENNKTSQDTEMVLRLAKHFPFHYNSKSYVKKREHKNRGLHIASEQYKKDLPQLTQYIHRHFTIEDFFPLYEKDSFESKSSSWEWMGDLYASLGAYPFADECYKKGYSLHKHLGTKLSIKRFFGSRFMMNTITRSLISFVKNKYIHRH